jgi:hypothetical protein
VQLGWHLQLPVLFQPPLLLLSMLLFVLLPCAASYHLPYLQSTANYSMLQTNC